MGRTIQKSKAVRAYRATARVLLRWGAGLLMLALMSGSALAGTITYNGTFFVDNGYNGGTPNDGIKNGGETGYTLNNISFSYTLSDGSSGNTQNASTSGTGSFTLSITANTGVSLTKLSINSVSDCSQYYTISGGSTGGTGGTFTAGSNCGFTMTWPTGAVLSGTAISGGAIGMKGKCSIDGYVFLNNGSAANATNQTMDSNESGFTAFAVAVEVTYTDPKTNQAIDYLQNTSTSTGAYPTIYVPQGTSNVKLTVAHTQLGNGGYFVDATQFSSGNSHIGDEDNTPTTITGRYGTYTQNYNPRYATLTDSYINTNTINNSITNLNFGVVPFNTLTLLGSSSSQVVSSGNPVTYEYKFTSYATPTGLQFAVTGGNTPVFYIKEASYKNPDCTQPYDTTTSATQYLNWIVQGATAGPGVSVCIEVVDTPVAGTVDQLTLYALYQYQVTNNPWTQLAGTTQTSTAVTGYPITGTVFLDDGTGTGGIANDGTKQASESAYTGATITASYTYAGLGCSSNLCTTTTATDSNGAFSIMIPNGATNVVITRGAITGSPTYIGTNGSGGTSTLKGTYARGATPATGDTVTITSMTGTVTGIAFGIVELNTLAPNGTKTTSAGTTIYYAHTFTAYTAGKVTFSSSDASGWTTSVLNDPTCSGAYVSSATNPVQAAVTFSSATTSVPGTICVLEAVTVPGSATSGSDVATISASYGYLSGSTTVFTYAVTATDTTTVTTSISGTVYVDANHDGSMDNGETAYATTPTLYAKLFLSSSGTAVAVATVTSGTFSLPAQSVAGTYTIHLSTSNSATSSTETPPPGYVETQNAGGYTFTYTSGGISGINFGLYSGAVVSGLVFDDNGSGTGGVAGDGIQNTSSEAGISGVTVSELASAGGTCSTSVCQTTTASNGTFTLYIPSGQSLAVLSRTPATGYMAISGKPGTTGGTWAASPEAVTFTSTAGTIYTGVTFGEVYLSVTVVKSANKSSASPGDTIIYTLQYANLSASTIALGTLKITDTVPTNTTFVSAGGSGCDGTTQVPAGSGLTACTLAAPAVGGTGNVVWTFTGSLSPNYSGTVTLTVKVK